MQANPPRNLTTGGQKLTSRCENSPLYCIELFRGLATLFWRNLRQVYEIAFRLLWGNPAGSIGPHMDNVLQIRRKLKSWTGKYSVHDFNFLRIPGMP